ncbi:hypothetical protein TNCV_5025671 [Trichonephila clavipes]|nr:hypothetical protein TNCV_5025671 [Trichonephila clavipes]
MVSPAVQGQVRHPSIFHVFLRSTSCGMTSARDHGAIVYCLNSGREKKRSEKRTKKSGENGRKEKEGWRREEREGRSPGLEWKKTMNAGDVEIGI